MVKVEKCDTFQICDLWVVFCKIVHENHFYKGKTLIKSCKRAQKTNLQGIPLGREKDAHKHRKPILRLMDGIRYVFLYRYKWDKPC